MKQSFFKGNRASLRKTTGDTPVVLAGNLAMQLTADMAAQFRQESNFWYLTGIEEPGWALVMSSSRDFLVMPDRSEVEMLFDGGMTPEAAKAISGVDVVIAYKEYLSQLKKLAGPAVYTLGPASYEQYVSFELNPANQRLRDQLQAQFGELKNCRPVLNRMKAIKQPEEVAAIERAINVTAGAFKLVSDNLDRYRHEYEIEADFTHYFRKNNMIHAYDPIVAKGNNACTLHYVANADVLSSGDLVLMDIGAYSGGYAADITRTYGVGEVSQRASELHHEVERAQQDIIAMIRPGLSVQKYHEAVDQRMKQALVNLNLMKDIADNSQYRKYFPHAISHGLGIDVHDSLGGPDEFKSGMVLTVEPGIYIPEEKIGVRIEDDILVTDDGSRNLSAALPTGL